MFAGLANGPLASIDIEVHGELAEHRVEALRLAALKGVFAKIVSDPVSYVNAPLIAEQRNVEVRFSADAIAESFRNIITIRGSLTDGTQLSVSGTLTGPKQIEKLIEVNGYDVELPLTEHLLVLSYTDRPGIVAAFGSAARRRGHQHREHADRPRRAARQGACRSSRSIRRFPTSSKLPSPKRSARTRFTRSSSTCSEPRQRDAHRPPSNAQRGSHLARAFLGGRCYPGGTGVRPYQC